VASIPTLELLLRIGQEREPTRAQAFAKDFGTARSSGAAWALTGL
jgi:hypothetical protein